MANKYGESWYDIPLLTFVAVVCVGTLIVGVVAVGEAVKAVWSAVF